MAALTSTRAEDGPRIPRRRSVDLVINLAVLAVLWIGYTAVRGVTADDFAVAMDNARDVLQVQNLLGLPSELGFQQVLIERTQLVKAANLYYIGVHFPATIGLLAWVWLRHRGRFDRIRNTLIAVTGAGLVIHVLFPLAPPRMVGGFVDTAAVFGPSPYDLSISQAANQIAAMPSLHVGWALIVSFGVITILHTRWRWLAIVHPAITLAVVVMTANHYWLDAAVAIALVLVGWIVFSRGRLAHHQTERPHAPTAAPTAGDPPVRARPRPVPDPVAVSSPTTDSRFARAAVHDVSRPTTSGTSRPWTTRRSEKQDCAVGAPRSPM